MNNTERCCYLSLSVEVYSMCVQLAGMQKINHVLVVPPGGLPLLLLPRSARSSCCCAFPRARVGSPGASPENNVS